VSLVPSCGAWHHTLRVGCLLSPGHPGEDHVAADPYAPLDGGKTVTFRTDKENRE
jgi:hypothetical protein